MSMRIRTATNDLKARDEVRARRAAANAKSQAAEAEKARRERQRLSDAWSIGGWLSAIVYSDFEPVAKLLRERGASACTEIKDTANSSSAYAFILDGVAWLVFRGTNDVNDWAQNLIWRPGRHYGFEKCFRDLRSGLDEWLDANLAEGMGVALTGHSLGGALAILAAEHVNGRGLPIEAVGTYGAPRCLPDRRAKEYRYAISDPSSDGERTLAAVTMRYFDQQETVVHVPPAMFGFSHVGQVTMVGLREKSGWWRTFVGSLKEAMVIGVFFHIAQFYFLTFRMLILALPAHSSVQYATRAGPSDPLNLRTEFTPFSSLSKQNVKTTRPKISAMVIVAIAVVLLVSALGAFVGVLLWMALSADWEAILAFLPVALFVAYLSATSKKKEHIL